MIGFQKGPAETGADCICEREDFQGVQFKWRESIPVILEANVRDQLTNDCGKRYR